MQSTSTLSGAHLRTYQAIIANPPGETVEWSAIRSLLEQFGQVTEEPNGNLTIARHGRLLVLHPALTKHLGESGEFMALRRFLHDVDTAPPESTGRDPHLLLVIHGQEARLFRCQVIGGIPQLVLPYEPDKHEPAEPAGRKPRRPPTVPNPDGFYALMAQELQIAGQIVVIAVGTGREAAEFVGWLQQHDSELSGRIIGMWRIEEPQLNETGLLAAAREFYATVNPPGSATVASDFWAKR